jgi:hypothetical protein
VKKPPGVRNPTLHSALEAFTTESAMRLSLAAQDGDEIPFEVIETDDGRRRRNAVPLYCYRPLTDAFIRERLGLLVALPTYAPAARGFEVAGGIEAYLRTHGERRVPEHARDRADAALRCFLARVFEERSEFGFDSDRFELAYDELERSLYQSRCVTEVITPLLGLELDPDSQELVIGDGLSVVRTDALIAAPAELLPRPGETPQRDTAHPQLLLVLRVAQERPERSPVSMARLRFRRFLSALRLFEHGRYALGPLGYSRIDDGVWSPIPLGPSGRSGLPTVVPPGQEDELRAFCNLIGRRLPAPGGGAESSGAGELAWALSRFEMGCERVVPFEALTDYLLALRALLEPEGPASGRLAQRLAVICAAPENRAEMAERTAHAIALERAVVAGLAPAENGPAQPADVLVDELAEHLRAILRDVLCGHLDADVRTVADELLADAAAA